MRKYDVMWFRDDKGTKGRLNATPMSHAGACAFKSKLTDYPWRRVALVEVFH